MAEPRTVRITLESVCDENSCTYKEKMEETVPGTLAGHPLFNLNGFTAIVQYASEHTRVTGHKVFFHGFTEEG